MTEVQEGIMMLWGAPFWKKLQQEGGENNGQQMVMITLEEFHEKYESTFRAEQLFEEIKSLWPVLHDYTGKLDKIQKNAMRKQLIEYKNYVKKAIHWKNAIESEYFDRRMGSKKERTKKIEYEFNGKIILAKKKYGGQGIPSDDLDLVDKIVELEGKIAEQLKDIHKHIGTASS